MLAHRQGERPNKTLAADPNGIICIDRAWRYILQLMHRDGASFVVSNLMLQNILYYGTGTTARGCGFRLAAQTGRRYNGGVGPVADDMLALRCMENPRWGQLFRHRWSGLNP